MKDQWTCWIAAKWSISPICQGHILRYAHTQFSDVRRKRIVVGVDSSNYCYFENLTRRLW